MLCERLYLGDIDRGARDLAGFEGVVECCFVDHGAARGVDEDRCRLHARECGGIEEVARFGRQGDVDADEVRLIKQLVEFGVGDPELRLGLGPAMVAVVEHAHVEPARPARHGPADGAEANDAERRLMDILAEQERGSPTRPASFANGALGLGDAARGGEEQGEGEVRRRFGEDARGVRDDDAAPRRCVDIDMVVADGHGADRAQARRRLQQAGIDVVREEAEQALRLAHGGQQLVARRRQIARPDGERCVLGEAVQRVAGELAGGEHGGLRFSPAGEAQHQCANGLIGCGCAAGRARCHVRSAAESRTRDRRSGPGACDRAGSTSAATAAR